MALTDEFTRKRSQSTPRARTDPNQEVCSNQPDFYSQDEHLATREQKEVVCEIVSTSQSIAAGTTTELYLVPEGFKEILQCKSDSCVIKLVDKRYRTDKQFKKLFYASEELRERVEENHGKNAALIPQKFLFSPDVTLPPHLRMGSRGFTVEEKVPGTEFGKLLLQFFIQTTKEDPKSIERLNIRLPSFVHSTLVAKWEERGRRCIISKRQGGTSLLKPALSDLGRHPSF